MDDVKTTRLLSNGFSLTSKTKVHRLPPGMPLPPTPPSRPLSPPLQPTSPPRGNKNLRISFFSDSDESSRSESTTGFPSARSSASGTESSFGRFSTSISTQFSTAEDLSITEELDLSGFSVTEPDIPTIATESITKLIRSGSTVTAEALRKSREGIQEDTLVNLMEHAMFKLENYKALFHQDQVYENQMDKIKELVDYIYTYLLLPLMSKTDMHPSLPGFLNTVKSQVAAYCCTTKNKSWICMIEELILILLQLWSSPNEILRNGAEQATKELSRNQIYLLPIFQLLSSENPHLHEQSHNALRNVKSLYILEEEEDDNSEESDQNPQLQINTDGPPEAFGDIRQLLQQLDVDLVDPEEILGCTNVQLRMVFPIFFKLLLNHIVQGKPTHALVVKGWKALFHRIHMDPYLSQLFYWMATIANIFNTKIGHHRIRIFYLSNEIRVSQEFFLETICSQMETLQSGFVFDDLLDVIDPTHECELIKKVVVAKIFDSKARPLLLEFTYYNGNERMVICKKGDDLRQDCYIQTIFQVFNELWTSSSISPKPFIHTYKCIPLADNFGFIECVANVKSAREFNWEQIRLQNVSEKDMFLRSLAGSYLASYVLGIRDRHQDNMLVKDMHIFFHIDFGHLWNQGPLIDAPRIAIPMRMKACMTEDEWNTFEELLLNGFSVLYTAGELISNMCTTLFHQIVDVTVVKEFISGKNSLMLDRSLPQAQQRLKKMLAKSTSSTNFKRKIKNTAHKWALLDPASPKLRSSREVNPVQLQQTPPPQQQQPQQQQQPIKSQSLRRSRSETRQWSYSDRFTAMVQPTPFIECQRRLGRSEPHNPVPIRGSGRGRIARKTTTSLSDLPPPPVIVRDDITTETSTSETSSTSTSTLSTSTSTPKSTSTQDGVDTSNKRRARSKSPRRKTIAQPSAPVNQLTVQTTGSSKTRTRSTPFHGSSHVIYRSGSVSSKSSPKLPSILSPRKGDTTSTEFNL